MEQKIQYVRISLEDYTKLIEANASLGKEVEKAMEHRWFVESKNKELTTALDIKEGKIITLEEENKKLINEIAKLEIEVALANKDVEHEREYRWRAEAELRELKNKEVNEDVCS
jgi:hypothetical protein